MNLGLVQAPHSPALSPHKARLSKLELLLPGVLTELLLLGESVRWLHAGDELLAEYCQILGYWWTWKFQSRRFQHSHCYQYQGCYGYLGYWNCARGGDSNLEEWQREERGRPGTGGTVRAPEVEALAIWMGLTTPRSVGVLPRTCRTLKWQRLRRAK